MGACRSLAPAESPETETPPSGGDQEMGATMTWGW